MRDYFVNTPTQDDVIEADLSKPQLWLQELLKPSLLILINNLLFGASDKINMVQTNPFLVIL